MNFLTFFANFAFNSLSSDDEEASARLSQFAFTTHCALPETSNIVNFFIHLSRLVRKSHKDHKIHSLGVFITPRFLCFWQIEQFIKQIFVVMDCKFANLPPLEFEFDLKNESSSVNLFCSFAREFDEVLD
jgi:hypothetical protein